MPVPLISDAPLTKDLVAETAGLALRARKYFDLQALEESKPATAEQVFEQLQSQYVAWRRTLHRTYTPAPANDASLTARRTELETTLSDTSAIPGSLRILSTHTMESIANWEPLWDEKPPQAPTATRKGTRERTDCRTGLAVPIATEWYSDEGRLLHSEPVPVPDVLAALRERHPEGSDIEPPNLLSPGLIASETCAPLAQEQLPGPGSVTPEQLRSAGTPEAMLLLIRSTL